MYASDTNIIKFRHLTVQKLKIFGDEIFLNLTLTENMESVDKKADSFFEVIETIINIYCVLKNKTNVQRCRGGFRGARGGADTFLSLGI